MKSKILFSLGLFTIAFIISGFLKPNNQEPWPVPDKYKNMKNPVKSDATSLAEGKELWSKHCQSCHGKTGLGDGSKAAQLKTEPGNFTKADVQSQTDGALFYKSSEGRDDMPNFKKKIPDEEERWSIINYIRTLKK